jgi:hypothetical protein
VKAQVFAVVLLIAAVSWLGGALVGYQGYLPAAAP